MKVVRLPALRNGRLYAPGNIPGNYFSHRPSAVGRIKSVTPSGIQPKTFRFLTQCVNQLCHRVPATSLVYHIKRSILILGTKITERIPGCKSKCQVATQVKNLTVVATVRVT